MKKFSAFQLAFLVSALIAAISCGGNAPRQLVSMTLSPAAGNAANSPNGQVQFSATGTYNKMPLTGSLQPALWGLYEPQSSTENPTITQSGLAQCQSNSGTFAVIAYAIADPSVPQTQQNLLKQKHVVLGTASLTCP